MSRIPSLSAVILTYNEEKHLQRCLDSLKNVCKEIYIVDSYSTDNTEIIARKNNVHFLQNKWLNYSNQFNWALTNIKFNTNWIIRIDADEYVTKELSSELIQKLDLLEPSITGINVPRLMYFMNKPLRKGGMYPIQHLKIWRSGMATCEQKWMDERMVLIEGKTVSFSGDIIDHNLNNIHWWSQKHIGYAVREAIDVLDKKYRFSDSYRNQSVLIDGISSSRSWFKSKYLKLPLFIRPFLFWFVRYIFQGGFLEGKRGFVWNLLQCFWYRFLVDVIIYEAISHSGENKENLVKYFKEEYGYDVICTNKINL